MNEKTKLLGALALGALAGAAIVKLLETDKGKELVNSEKDKMKSSAEDIKAKINELENELADLLKSQDESSSNHNA